MTRRNTDEPSTPDEADEARYLQSLIPDVDLKDARQRIADDIPLIIRLLQQFSDDCLEMEEYQAAALETIDVSTLGQEMHRIRGAAGNLAATRVGQQALAIEQWIETRGADSQNSPAIKQELTPLLNNLRRGLSDLRLALRAAHDVLPSESPIIPAQTLDYSLLRTALKERNFDAVARFREARDKLEAALSPREFADLKAAVEKLDFRRAAALLPAHF